MSKGKPKGNPGENEKPAKLVAMRVSSFLLAETQGFEPWIRVLPRCALSRGVPSTARPRLQKGSADKLRTQQQGAKYIRRDCASHHLSQSSLRKLTE